MVRKSIFGRAANGREIEMYTITNSRGEYADILNYGACVHKLFVPDRDGRLGDVIIGARDAEQLTAQFGPARNPAVPFGIQGATLGRFANRILGGRFSIDGREIILDTRQQLAGQRIIQNCGRDSYGDKFFDAEFDENGNSVVLHYLDADTIGFGCDVDVRITVSFDDERRLTLDYDLVPDGDTIISPTNHAYFNLGDNGDIRDDIMRIYASRYAVKTDAWCPVGGIGNVEGTPLDYREPRRIGDMLEENAGGYLTDTPAGYDDIFLFDKGLGFGLAAEVESPRTGRTMKVYTDHSSMILFTPTPRFFTEVVGKDNVIHSGYFAYCFETQHVPNSPNCPEYDSPLIRAGEHHRYKTVYQFGVKE